MIKQESIKFVNRFFTPFAVLVVLSGVLFGEPSLFAVKISLSILSFTMLFNAATSYLSKALRDDMMLLSRVRLLVNFTMNVFLVFHLGMYWKPIWLLFVLTPVATAIYNTAERTLATCVITTIVLVLVYFVKGLSSAAEWGEVVNNLLFIYVISLFVNRLVRTYEKNR